MCLEDGNVDFRAVCFSINLQNSLDLLGEGSLGVGDRKQSLLIFTLPLKQLYLNLNDHCFLRPIDFL